MAILKPQAEASGWVAGADKLLRAGLAMDRLQCSHRQPTEPTDREPQWALKGTKTIKALL